MTNIITNPPSIHILLLHIQTIMQPLFVVHPNIILFLVTAPPVIITPFLNDTTLLTALLLNQVMIATVLNLIQTQKTTPILNINTLLFLLTHLHHLFKVIFLQKF